MGASRAAERPGLPGNLEGIQPSAHGLAARPWGGLFRAGRSHAPHGPARDRVPKVLPPLGRQAGAA